MSLIKPEKGTQLLSIIESLVEAMIRCIDKKLEGLAMQEGRFGRRRLEEVVESRLKPYIKKETESKIG